MATKKRKKSRIPRFKTYEEEAEWWDTHDTTEFEDEFTPVKLEFAKPLIHILGVRLDAKTIDELDRRGREIGLGASTLARMWIMERLNQLKKEPKPVTHQTNQLDSSAILHQIRASKKSKRS